MCIRDSTDIVPDGFRLADLVRNGNYVHAKSDNVSIHRARTSTLNIEARPRKGSACNALLSCAGFLNQPYVLAAFLPQFRHRKNGRKSITVSSGMIASFRAAGNPKRYIEADMRIRKPLNARDTKVT